MGFYEKEIIRAVQQAVDLGKIEMKNLSYDDLKVINLANVYIKLENTQYGRNYILDIKNEEVTKEYLSVWKTYPIGHFLPKDYRKDVKDFLGNNPYYSLYYRTTNKKYIAIVRLLVEMADDDLTVEEKDAIAKDYHELTINGKSFSIIKIVEDTDDRSGWVTHENTIHFYRNTIEVEEDENDLEDADENNNSDEITEDEINLLF